MSSVDRQNKLIAAEDWKKVYQSFKNADFKSYDFDNLRRTMVTYLRENYPEDFNDYIESSEYLALIDLIAFLGQNLAFRFDLNARDNFLELADRRESILRLARLLSYNPKRNQPAHGLLKFTSVRTTESVIDSNGRDIANQTVSWNDSANVNWYEQFIKVLNAAMPTTSQVGKPQDSGTIGGIRTQQYRFNSTNSDAPIYKFSKNIDGRNMDFEIVSSSFKNSSSVFEEAPYPGNNLAFLYRDDGGGAPSSNTGFFVQFRQGSIQDGNFSIQRPSTNETVDLDTSNINNSDVWLYSVDSNGLLSEQWTKIDSVEGNNVIYNSASKSTRKIFSAITRTGDRVRLSFADGVFGDLPQGNFKVYYRTSNGFEYAISPTNIKNVSFDIPYVSNKSGKQETLTVSVGLNYTVSNASASESSDSIKSNAPATYYTQNRMITGEDYNVFPLSINQEIIKVKSINRVSSGISRYFDLKDTTGKYSNTNLFGTDGILYKEPIIGSFKFNYNTRTDIENAVLNLIEPTLASKSIKDFYLDSYAFVSLSVSFAKFKQVTTGTNVSTGSLTDLNAENTHKKLGAFTYSNLRYIVPGAMIKFEPPRDDVTGEFTHLFDENNNLVEIAVAPVTAKNSLWAKVVQVVADGSANGTGVLPNGSGPIVLNEQVPTNAWAVTVVPKFVTALETSVKNKIIDLIFSNKNFALRYDTTDIMWKIITDSNVNKKSAFALGKTGDQSNQQLDSSWILLFETDGETYTSTYRGLRYVFESEAQIRFFFDSTDKVYDPTNGRIIRDKISVMNINTAPDSVSPFNQNFDWEIVNEYLGSDGYIDTKKISISFFDSNEDGTVDDPEIFKTIVAPSANVTSKFIFQKRQTALDGATDYYYIKNTNGLIRVYLTQDQVPLTLDDGQLVYIIKENLVKKFNKAAINFVITNEYRGFYGRDGIKFQYIHAADNSSRLDPAATNIIDIYMLTKTYDTEYRRWLSGEISVKPLPPSSDALYTNFSTDLNKVKSISDEIVYHPAKYKPLFGKTAAESLQGTFKVVKNSNIVISDNDIKSNVITAINEFFAIENWEFGDTFYFGELAAYVMQQMTPNLVNLVIVPKQQTLAFGSLFEISSNSDEILISSATVDDVEIISEITAARINANGTVLTSLPSSNNDITSV
jgi:hypothetical protein